MKITRRQLQRLRQEKLADDDKEIHPRTVAKNDNSDMTYSEDMIQIIFSQLGEDFWTLAGDTGSSVLRAVGPNALKDLAKFIKNNPAWKHWYEKEADDAGSGNL